MQYILLLLLCLASPTVDEPGIVAAPEKGWIFYPNEIWRGRLWPAGRYKVINGKWYRLGVGVEHGFALPK